MINKKKTTDNTVLKNIAGQCINETELQTFNFGAKIDICEAPQRFQYISVKANQTDYLFDLID